MPGTSGALRAIELASACLCQAMSRSVVLLEHALSAEASDTECDITPLEAVTALTDQLNLQRSAWGSADQPLSIKQMMILARGLSDQIAVDVSNLSPSVVFPAMQGRILLNVLLLAADSLPDGGSVVLAGGSEDLFIRIAGPAAAWPAGMAMCLIDEAQAYAALTEGRHVQMALTALLAHDAHIRLSFLLPASSAQAGPAILRLGG
jgi:hypothetical protein